MKRRMGNINNCRYAWYYVCKDTRKLDFKEETADEF